MQIDVLLKCLGRIGQVKIISLASLILSASSGLAPAQEKIVLGGAGGIIPLMQELTNTYQAKNPSHTLELMPNSLGSTGGIKAAAAGRVSVGLVSRSLREEEKGKLVHQVFGRGPVVVAINKGVLVSNLSESQICDIYGGKIKSWSEVGAQEAKIAVLTRQEDDSTKEVVRQKIGCFQALKEGPEVIVLTTSKQMIDALGARPSTIGLTEYGAMLKAEGRFKAVAINGVGPSSDSMRSGSYKVFKEFGVVTLGKPQGLVKQFLDFVVSPEGDKILGQNGITLIK